MKKLLIMFLSFLISCYSFKPVSTIDNFQLYQEYLDLQYKLSQKEQEYNDLSLSYLDLGSSYQPPVKRYNVTAERSNIGSFAQYWSWCR